MVARSKKGYAVKTIISLASANRALSLAGAREPPPIRPTITAGDDRQRASDVLEEDLRYSCDIGAWFNTTCTSASGR
jgi:hypothetical protein